MVELGDDVVPGIGTRIVGLVVLTVEVAKNDSGRVGR